LDHGAAVPIASTWSHGVGVVDVPDLVSRRAEEESIMPGLVVTVSRGKDRVREFSPRARIHGIGTRQLEAAECIARASTI